MIDPLLAGSGSSSSTLTGPKLAPPSEEIATLRYPERPESRELSITRPSDSSTTLFSSIRLPPGLPDCQVCPWSSEKIVTAWKSPDAVTMVNCWSRRPAYCQWRS